jgi:predicted dithiol-disulfide oxidoreductase (DUF899 family)
MTLPRVVSKRQWQAAQKKLLAKEKALTRKHDALAAERRRMPMVKIAKPYMFEGPDGKASLLDLFDSRRQLIIYHFMFAPSVEGWPNAGCPGCSFFVDQISNLAHLHARDTSLVLVSVAPLANIMRYKQRMGWTIPWYSSVNSDFNVDFGLSRKAGETFGLSAFFRDGDTVYRNYHTNGRGVEMLGRRHRINGGGGMTSTAPKVSGVVFSVFSDLSTAVERSESAPSLERTGWDGRWPTSVLATASPRLACRGHGARRL